jgi:Protein of unknown function (DUF1553)/Protein of unknown function (DUF1549)
MKSLMVCAALLGLVAIASADLATIYEKPGEPAEVGKIDALVFARLKAEGVPPARLCSDAVFLRRAYLDVIGTLPRAGEVREFLADKAPDKRAKLIDRLLDRDEYADYWAMRWGDLLRVKSEFPINLWPNAVQAYHRWIHTAMAGNMPYDQFARALLTSSGSNFREPPVNFYRATQGKDPETLARAAALAFMGDRMSSWPEKRRAGMAVFFSRVGYKRTAEWKEEIIFFDMSSKVVPTATLPDGTEVRLAADQDPREVFADWLISPNNPWFARAIVNRLWYWLLGRGIIHEPDDIRADNVPSHPKLLALLEKELIASKYDLKHVLRLILNSSTYQLSSVPRSQEAKAADLFAHYRLRRLDAEVLIDALCQITGTTEEYSSQIPEPFTWVPTEMRSIALSDGSITSSFLEMFGRPPRDTGMAAERNNTPTAAQRLHLLNSGHIRRKIERGPGLRVLGRMARRTPGKAIVGMYLAILSRYPTAEELKTLKAYGDANRKTRGADTLIDMIWALVNSPEFLYRH